MAIGVRDGWLNMTEANSIAAGGSAINDVIDFIVDVMRCEDGFKDFNLPPTEHQELTSYLLETYPSASEPISPRLQREMTLEGVDYLKRLQTYRDFLHQRNRGLVLDALDSSNVPREQFTDLVADMASFQPKDCMALQDWPERRKPAGGESGRLENAGQFMQRLMDEKLYDEKKFGKLYLFDLRNINPKLYQALVQWQKRTGHKLLANKSDEIDELLQKSEGQELDFFDTSRVSKARWRRQGSNP